MKAGDQVCLTHYPECIGTVVSLDEPSGRATIEWRATGLVNTEPIENLTNLSQVSAKAADKYCNHDWVRYTGFTQSYRFCSHCDLKESPHDVRRGHHS